MKQQDSFETLCSRLGVKFVCRYCQSESIVKSGKNCNDRHRYQCKHCHKRFITEYIYNAYLPDTDSKITQLTKEGLGNHSTILTLGIMIYQHSFLFTLKGFCQLHCLLLQSDKKLGISFKFTEQSLSSGNRMISIEGFHGFVVQHAYLIHHGDDFGEFLQVRLFCRVFRDNLKGFTQKPCSDKIAFCLCSRLAIESDKFLLVFRIRYPDVPSVPFWAGATSAVWLVYVLSFHRFLVL